MSQGTLHAHGWTVSPLRNRCERDGVSVQLAPRAMDVLVCLIDHAGEVLSHEQLICKAWHGRAVGDEQLYKRISEIRQALGDSSGKHPIIETIPKRGYRLVPSKHEPQQTTEPPRTYRVGARYGVAAAVLAAIALGAVALHTHPGGAPLAPAPAAAIHFQRAADPAISSGEAYDLYLMAGTDDSSPGLPSESRHVYLDRALTLDPDFALAHARKASAYTLSMLDNLISGPAGEDAARASEQAYQHAWDALELDPNLVEAHIAMARLQQFTWRWRAAQEHYEHAYDGDPDNIDLLRMYSHFASFTGSHALATALTERAITLYPDVPSLQFRLGTVLLNQGKVANAADALERAIEMDARLTIAHVYLGLAQVMLNRPNEGVREFAVACALLERDPLPFLLALVAYGYSRVGDADSAALLLARHSEVSKSRAAGAGSHV